MKRYIFDKKILVGQVSEKIMLKFNIITLSWCCLMLSNLTHITKKFVDNFEVRESVINFFYNSGYDPAPQKTVPTNYPLYGMAFVVEFRY